MRKFALLRRDGSLVAIVEDKSQNQGLRSDFEHNGVIYVLLKHPGVDDRDLSAKYQAVFVESARKLVDEFVRKNPPK